MYSPPPKSVNREGKQHQGDPVLTHANLLKQAVKFGQQHMAEETSLQEVLSCMHHQDHWVPSRELERNGIPLVFHEMFADRVTKKQRTYTWMLPHAPSNETKRWLDIPSMDPITPGL